MPADPQAQSTDFDLVPIERLRALERQVFRLLPNNPIGHDLRSVVLEAIARRMEAMDVH